MDIEKSCICVLKGPKQFLTQCVGTRSYHLSTLNANQCQDSPQVLLRHLSNHLRTVPPIYPLYSRQIDHPVTAPCSVLLRLSCIFPLLPCSLVYRPFHIPPQKQFPDLPESMRIDDSFHQ